MQESSVFTTYLDLDAHYYYYVISVVAASMEVEDDGLPD